MIKVFQQGGQMNSEQEEFTAYLISVLEPTDQNDFEAKIKSLGEDQIKQLYQKFKQEKTVMAKNGSKLNYFNKLNGIAEEVDLFKTGGCIECNQKKIDLAACGGKAKKKKRISKKFGGGFFTGVEHMQDRIPNQRPPAKKPVQLNGNFNMLNIGQPMGGFNALHQAQQNIQPTQKTQPQTNPKQQTQTPTSRMPEKVSNNREYRYPTQFDDYDSGVTLPKQKANLSEAGYNMVNIGQRFSAPQFNALAAPGTPVSIYSPNQAAAPQGFTGIKNPRIPATVSNQSGTNFIGGANQPSTPKMSTPTLGFSNPVKAKPIPQLNIGGNKQAPVSTYQGELSADMHNVSQVGPQAPQSPQQKKENAKFNGSIVDYLVSKGIDHSLTNRRRMYEQMFGQEYDMNNTAASNLRLLSALQSGQDQAKPMAQLSTPKPTVGGVQPSSLNLAQVGKKRF